jgi:site-specific recombinase XerC
VLYCARHTFGTVAVADSQNPAAVMDAMGHEDLKTTLAYQHQDLRVIRDVIDRKNERLERTQIRTQQFGVNPFVETN